MCILLILHSYFTSLSAHVTQRWIDHIFYPMPFSEEGVEVDESLFEDMEDLDIDDADDDEDPDWEPDKN